MDEYKSMSEYILGQQKKSGSYLPEALRSQPKTRKLCFTLWDVGHGLSICIETPAAHNHWIDLGKSDSFSPSKHVKTIHNISKIDYLIISHPDQDHLADLPNFLESFGDPRVLHRNKSLPDKDKYGDRALDYQKEFKKLDNRFSGKVDWSRDPGNPEYNGGIEYCVRRNNHNNEIEGNNTSLVTMILYKALLLVCPGDIEDKGWQALWQKAGSDFQTFIKRAMYRVLVAPHHGRKTGYSVHMMDKIKPHVSIISDIWGESATDPAFREQPLGIKFKNGQMTKYYSTKRGGRIQIIATQDGKYSFNQYE